MSTHYKITESDMDLVEEFDLQPVGLHSPRLQRVLNQLRGESVAGKFVLVTLEPHKKWALAQLPKKKGEPVRILKDQIFKNLDEAERAIFRLRWKKHTGKDLP